MIGEKFKQAPRLSTDGAVSVSRTRDDHIQMACETAGVTASLIASEHNASRLLGMLALMLGVKISKADAKEIKF